VRGVRAENGLECKQEEEDGEADVEG